MRFLGGVLKFLAILILLVATVGCTAVAVIEGVVNGYEEALWVMGLVWICVLFVALNILGTGIALTQVSKLKKRVQQLEQRSVAPIHTADANADAEAVPAVPAEAPVAAPEQKRLVPVIVTAVVGIIAIALIAVISMLSGGKDTPPVVQQPDVSIGTYAPDTEEPTEPAPVIEATEIHLGETLSTDFVELTFLDATIAPDVKYSVKTGNVTRITGPEPIPGQQYICLTGVIKNISTSPLPVYDFYVGNFNFDGYNYTVESINCDILDGEGSTEHEIDPLMEYTVRIYVAIPDALAEDHASCVFTFGFYDLFDNEELSYNRAFSDDPIAACPYQFVLPIK